jgi:hypothetical protein
MVTYAQLQAEPWWGREIVTPEVQWMGAELCRRTSRPADAAGNKGNNVHLRGAHRSQEWILRSAYCTSRTYTVQSGLTAEQARHVAGFDFTPGDVEAMIAQSRRLMAAVKAGVLEEVREVYCNVDGDQVVDGWDNVRDRAATSDSSHLWHWHLTLDRRRCADRSLMERIVAIALGSEDDMTPEQDNTLKQIALTLGWLIQGKLTTGKQPGIGELTFPIVPNQQLGAVSADVAALRTAFAAIASAGTSADAAAITAKMEELAAADKARDEQHATQLAAVQQQLAHVQAENEDLRGRLAAALKG